jgi:hypothetical protein
MTFIVTKTTTRPNKNVPFYQYTDETQNYIKTTYDSTGKRTNYSVISSPDGLQQIVKSTWPDHATYDSFISDTNLLGVASEVVAHNSTNGLTQFTEITPI